MMSNQDRLIYMVDQIARNFAALGHDHAVEATADHIVSFWDPRMKAQILSIAETQPERLSSAAASAIERLRQGPISPQTPATEFNSVNEGGHSDAG